MNKQETAIVVLLFAALMAIMVLNRPKPGEEPVQPEGVAQEQVAVAAVNVSESSDTAKVAEPEKPEAVVKHAKEEQTQVLSSDLLDVRVSSWGGGIVAVSLKEYDKTRGEKGVPVVLDFAGKPALSLSGLPGMTTGDDFAISRSGNTIQLQKDAGKGISLTRTIEIGEDYSLKIKDVFSNVAGKDVRIPEHAVQIGAMQKIQTTAKTRGPVAFLGVDTLGSSGSDSVVYWAKKGANKTKNLSKRFLPEGYSGGCLSRTSLSAPLVKEYQELIKSPTDWVAVKNKFFVQILAPSDDAVGFTLNAKREVSETEDPAVSKTWSKNVVLGEVDASMEFAGVDLRAGEAYTREMNYYVGPKKYSTLKTLGNYQDKVMFRTFKGFGWFRTICIGMLYVMNLIYSVFRNYGVAIILLTVIMKIIFWPITHKSTEGMKKMQSIQPLVAELKEKYKDNPEKMQKAQMALYKEHGVNPMSSCLPMLIQMPVFIAMFTVLRNAVELRYASFLWIKDLTEPEALFSGAIPFVGSLNILPLAMAFTMFLQQKMSPQSGDAQQRQMMVFMPIMMLVMLYNMAAGLMLYWTVSQLLSIAQLLVNKKKEPAVA